MGRDMGQVQATHLHIHIISTLLIVLYRFKSADLSRSMESQPVHSSTANESLYKTTIRYRLPVPSRVLLAFQPSVGHQLGHQLGHHSQPNSGIGMPDSGIVDGCVSGLHKWYPIKSPPLTLTSKNATAGPSTPLLGIAVCVCVCYHS